MVVAALGSSWATVDEDTASQITSQFIKIATYTKTKVRLRHARQKPRNAY